MGRRLFCGRASGPIGLVLPDTLAKVAVFLAGAGHDTDEAAAATGQALQVFLRGQLAVGHINEVGALEQPAQALMVFRVQAVVGLIARIDLMEQGHRTVGRYR